jgi:hypothetical protein
VTNAEQIMANPALCDKMTASILGRIDLVEAETGFRPVAWKAQMQLADDSVLEIRAVPCSDGCGQAKTTMECCPALRSPS